MNLQEAGLFKMKDKKAPGYFDWNWTKIKDQLNLVNADGVNFMSPSDISYVYNGYSPISVKIIEQIIDAKGITPIKNLLKLVGLTEDKLRIPQGESQFFNSQAPNTNGRPGFRKKKILVYFIGGITYAEIAALRFLMNLNPMIKFIIATTSIINGDSAVA
eukprot:CAMPEP_0170486452 /NCGR_PEP_ID=MMETSP0208-20121228/5474_1 /TAXON_ID=197538 /ORGANISM="Strombidium inclinatum, Strain S3" /LENGTH=159 /DNA_ID=CAMNT_0010760407 /DNA_START=1295 /DNA_END=1774 /DNA_ORIENTATION=+